MTGRPGAGLRARPVAAAARLVAAASSPRSQPLARPVAAAARSVAAASSDQRPRPSARTAGQLGEERPILGYFLSIDAYGEYLIRGGLFIRRRIKRLIDVVEADVEEEPAFLQSLRAEDPLSERKATEGLVGPNVQRVAIHPHQDVVRTSSSAIGASIARRSPAAYAPSGRTPASSSSRKRLRSRPPP